MWAVKLTAPFLVFAALGLVACDANPQGIAAGLTDQGTILIEVVRCHEEEVRRLEVRSGETTVWAVSNRGSSNLATFVLGVTPDGFNEDVPLTATVEGDFRILVVRERASRQQYETAANFDFDELRAQELLLEGDYFSMDEFPARARGKVCDDGGLF